MQSFTVHWTGVQYDLLVYWTDIDGKQYQTVVSFDDILSLSREEILASCWDVEHYDEPEGNNPFM